MSKKAQQATAKLKTKPNSDKKKKQFKMWSAFSILLLIIAILIFVSWILKWTGVTAEISADQFLQFNNGNWEKISELPSSSNGLYQSVTWTWWQANQATVDQNSIYLVRGFQETATINALGILDLFVAPAKGFMDKVGVIIFIIAIGSFVFIVVRSKALEGFSQGIIRKLKGKEIWAIIPLMLFFSISGTVNGMAEESLGFYAIVVPLMLAAGFDTMTGLLVVFLGSGIGVIASTVNPFMISVALAGLNNGTVGGPAITVGDGLVWRLVSWFIMTALAIGFVMWYAKRIQNNPTKSITFATRDGDKKFFLTNGAAKVEMNWRRKTTLWIFWISFIFMILYLVDWDSLTNSTFMADMATSIHQYFPYFDYTIPGFGLGGLEFVASFFILSAILVGMVMYIKPKVPTEKTAEENIISDFVEGANEILSVCLIIATASGIGFVLEQSHMQELIINALASSIGGISSGIGKILILFILFIPLSFLIPSTSGFATAVFPLLTGVVSINNGAGFDPVTASGSITAFSFAEGLVNLLTPTSGVVMGAMALSRVDYGKFVKFIAPFVGILFVITFVLLAIGGAIGGNIA